MTFKADLGRIPSALPLPETSGTTAVEQMIQLGELLRWITQKNEHIWLYQRALSQTFYNTLLKLGPMFDLAELKQLFKDQRRNIGAGMCSKNLIDAVEDLVETAAASDKAGQTFMFDAKEILGRQYQPKFCSSVEVVMKPYHGQDIYGHKAQHFREAFFLFSQAHSRLFLGCFLCATSNGL